MCGHRDYEEENRQGDLNACVYACNCTWYAAHVGMKKTIVSLSFSFSFAFSSSITRKIGICGIDSTRRGLSFSLSLSVSRLAVESTLLFLSMTISDKQYRDAHNKSIYHRTLLHLTTVCLFLLCMSLQQLAKLMMRVSLSFQRETIASEGFVRNAIRTP